VEGVGAERLVVPAAVIDVTGCDRDFALAPGDVEEAERRDGPIEAGSAVLLRTGWDQHHRNGDKYLGPEGDLHFPGFGPDAARLLVARGVAGLGIDTLSVDRGCDEAVPVHHVTLPAGLWHLEGLVNLGELPARGALLVAAPIKLVGGSGAPARVLALLDV
jgi:kynurenine formamidase